MKYRVLQAIWQSGEQRHYEAGSVCELAHLDESAIDMLIALKVVAPEVELADVDRPSLPAANQESGE